MRTEQETIHQVGASATGLYRLPSADSHLETESLYGENVRVLGVDGEWTKVVTVLDYYPGHILTADLRSDIFEPTHRVSEKVVPVYWQPSFKWPIRGLVLYMNSLLMATGKSEDTPEGQMVEIEGLGWVFLDQVREVHDYATDHVAEVLKLVGDGYGWGPRSSLWDCSSAIQAGVIATGRSCPRDSVPQSQVLGEEVDFAPDFSNLRRGDFVFWTEGKGRHVVVMTDETDCFNASIARPRKARVHSLKDAIAEQARDGNGAVTGVRRFPDYAA